MSEAKRAQHVAQQLESYRLSILAEIESQRRALESLRGMLTFLEQEPDGGHPETVRAIRIKAADAATSSRQIETLLGHAERSVRELERLLNTLAEG